MARGLTAQEINTWNRRVKRAAARGIYVGERITRKIYNQLSKQEKASITRLIRFEKGKKIEKGRKLVDVGPNVRATDSAYRRLVRRSSSEIERRKEFNKRVGEKFILTPQGDIVGQVKDLESFGEFVIYPRKNLKEYAFKNVAEIQNYFSNYATPFENKIEAYKEKYLNSIYENIQNYIPEDRKAEFYEIMDKIARSDPKKFIEGYYSTQESSLTESFQWFYSMEWVKNEDRARELVNMTDEYLDMLIRAFG